MIHALVDLDDGWLLGVIIMSIREAVRPMP
jgi:hypothetical protein